MDKPLISFQEADPDGGHTLKVVATADAFNEWMFQTIRPFLNGEILEIGSGIGTITAYALNSGYSITASDIREVYCQQLLDRFDGHPNLKAVINIDIIHPNFDKVYAPLLGQFDALFALNVIEHIEDDVLAIRNCRKLLKTNGKLIILVPAYPCLYNRFDEVLGLFKRYTKSGLIQKFKEAELQIVRSRYFNVVGLIGWWFSGSILRRKTIPEGQMKLYNSMVPFFKLIDRIMGYKMGLSVIAVGLKTEEQ